MRRYTIGFTPHEDGQAARRESQELTFGVSAGGLVLLAAPTWDFVAGQLSGIGSLATMALTQAAKAVGARYESSWGMYFEEAAAPGLRAEIFGGLERSIRGRVFLHGSLYVGGADASITSTQPLATPATWKVISDVSHVMASLLFCEFHTTQRLAERAGAA